MRKSFWIFFILAIVLCVLLLFLKRQHQNAVNVVSENVPQQSQVATNQLVQQPSQIAVPVVATNNSHIIVTPPPPSETNNISPQLLANWQGSIEFYGKVVDENSNSVADASVHFQWSEKPAKDGMRIADAQSDVQGLFSLQGARGLVLTVSVSKVGYYSSHKDNDSYTYGSLGGATFSPDAQNPVIFHLRKRSKGVSLIETKFPPGMRIVQLHHDGTPVLLDLLSGSQVAAGSGQLELQFLRDLSENTAKPFAWKLQLSAPTGGGLIPTDEEFAFQAPQNGYQSSIVIDMPATNQDWSDNFSAEYYIQLPNGDFGRFDLNLLAHNGAFTVTSAINPTGSPNLEPAQ
jgi:hypothetical protein